jgi:hypothetical protein
VRALRIVRQALLCLLGSGLGAVALLTCVRELVRAPNGAGLWGGAVPITQHKWPWVLVLAALLVTLWVVVRSVGGARGLLWGGLMAGLRTGFWWSIAALLVFLGVAIRGFATHPIADLSWPFALGYLLSALLVLALCVWLQRRLRLTPGSAAQESAR